MVGKPKYMAPEIMNYKDEGNWNAADVYSFMKVIIDAAQLVEVSND